MHLYVFSGVVTPERAWLEIPGPVKVEFSHPESRINGSGNIEIYKNQIIYALRTTIPLDDIFSAKNVIADQVQELLDAICLNSTVAYSADIRSLFNPDTGLSTVFGISEPTIGVANDGHMQIDIQPYLQAISGNPYLRRAIADFRSAVRYPGETGFFTYRAIESLIQDIKNIHGIPDRRKPDAIKIITESLNIDQEDIAFLRSMSGDVRHGKPTWISGENRIKCLTISRQIIVNYMFSTK